MPQTCNFTYYTLAVSCHSVRVEFVYRYLWELCDFRDKMGFRIYLCPSSGHQLPPSRIGSKLVQLLNCQKETDRQIYFIILLGINKYLLQVTQLTSWNLTSSNPSMIKKGKHSKSTLWWLRKFIHFLFQILLRPWLQDLCVE